MPSAQATSDPTLRGRPTAVYRLFNVQGELLYIGMSVDPDSRFRYHRVVHGWWSDVASIEVDRYPNRPLAADAEKRAIQSERPRHNRTHADHGDRAMSVAEVRSALAETVELVIEDQACVVVTAYGARQAAIVPVEVAEAVDRHGGPDAFLTFLSAAERSATARQ